jgi:hypothetical protein
MVTEAARGWDDEGFLNVSGLCNIAEYSALLIGEVSKPKKNAFVTEARYI